MSVPFWWLKKELEDQGFSVIQTNKGHFWVLSPEGRKIKMNKKAIELTALCRFDEAERVFIVQSPIFERVIGAAKTESEAWKIFDELLVETYIAHLEGTLVEYEKRGRPAKGNVQLHAQVKPEVKKKIDRKALELGISQGEVINYLCAVEDARVDLEKRYTRLKTKLRKIRK